MAKLIILYGRPTELVLLADDRTTIGATRD